MTGIQYPYAREPKRSRWQPWERLVVVGCLAMYVGLAVFQLPLPGPEYDETIFGPAALGCTRDFLSPTSTLPLDSAARFSPLAFSPFSFCLGPHSVPLMVTPYQGALKVYLLAAIFSVWDVSAWTLRLPNVVVGMLTLVFFVLGVARLFSPRAALVALVFLASDPSYIFYTRHDFNPSALVLLFVGAPLWCLARWAETNQTWLWAGAFFLCGLGLYNRLDHGWFLAAAGATGLGYWWRSGLPRVSRKEVILAGGCFVLGCAPYIFFVWQRPSIATSVLSMAGPTQELSAAARVKGYMLWTVLNGRSLYDFFAGHSGVNMGRVVTPQGDTQVGSFAASEQSLLLSSLFTGTLTPYCLLAMLVGVWFVRPPPALRALGVFLAWLSVCILVVQGALRGHHFVLFLPFVLAFLAASLFFLWAQLGSWRARTTLIALGMACLSANLAIDIRYHRLLAETGGRGVWSDAIYDLTEYLQHRCLTQRCFIGDWGIGTPVLTLSGGTLAVEEFFWPYLQGGDPAALGSLVRTEPALFIFYADPYVNFSRPKRLFWAAAREADRRVAIERIFNQRDGTPVIEIVKLEKERRSR